MRTFSSTCSHSSSTDEQQKQFSKTKPPSIAASRCAFAPTPSQNAKSGATTSPDRTTKYATVTMMLAERIIRNDWSVEDEHFFKSNNMNVWQTLEFLSGQNSRKRYNYEGYNDANNAMRSLTPSWRRDSFVEKNANPNGDQCKSTQNRKYSTVANNALPQQNNFTNNVTREGVNGKGSRTGSAYSNEREQSAKFIKSSTVRRGLLKKKNLQTTDLDPEYALSPSDYADLIKCTFNLPRISAALERLMGTNVVRLTDRNYMKELRERIEDDYRANLQKRIRARELKEVERERVLIIEGKTNIIPAELADDPIFVVDKKADLEIARTRAKLKTNREKNSDRLKLQGVKWERERLQHEEEEAERLNAFRQKYKEQKQLEEQYKNEDANRGMNLLRIDNEDWRPCEQQLKEFLEQERAKMKARSLRVPTPFTSDPKDIKNILKARKAFREVERRIRKTIEDKHQENSQQKQQPTRQQSSPQLVGSQYNSGQSQSALKETRRSKDLFENIDLDTTFMQKTLTSDDDSDISSSDSSEAASSLTLAKQHHIEMLQQDLDSDVAAGLVISKDQYDHLRYEDDKIMRLRNAKDIRELYQLAEEIIIGERLEIYGDEEEAIAEEEEDEEKQEEQPEVNQPI